jgi:hypothetical protein
MADRLGRGRDGELVSASGCRQSSDGDAQGDEDLHASPDLHAVCRTPSAREHWQDLADFGQRLVRIRPRFCDLDAGGRM